ncbi:GAF domain-containing protein [bacterium]|nr:GAF domain-containing protein [bacterium]
MSSTRTVYIVYRGGQNQQEIRHLLAQGPNHWRLVQTLEPGSDGSKIFLLDEDGAARSALNGDVLEEGAGVLQLIGPDQEPEEFSSQGVRYLETPLTRWRLFSAIHQLAAELDMNRQLRFLQQELDLRSRELSDLNKIGVALSAERDAIKLLELILSKAREITAADAGSLYLIEKIPNAVSREGDPWADKQLRFKLAQNDSLHIDYQEFVLPIQRQSMAGYAVVSGNPLNIADAYHLPKGSEFQHNRSFDERTGYHTQSVLCIPMKSHQGELIGVLQLINRKQRPEGSPAARPEIVPFDDRCVELASSLAGQAAVSIENMRLYEDIKRLFEGFILASVHAIEQRDPTTSGHSERVAVLTVAMAEQVDRSNRAPFQTVHFNRDDLQQVKYAALLHDFGKIGVREHVLVKAKKLYPEQLEMIKLRFRYLKKMLEAKTSREKISFLLSRDARQVRTMLSRLDQRFMAELHDLDGLLQFILEANEPRVLPENDRLHLFDLGRKIVQDEEEATPLLNPDEIQLLSISRGSLSEKERQEIESHVTHTYNFLSRIPWAAHLRDVPLIAYAHHEKLDGTGYPRRLPGEQIPLPAKMMAIADIYDALTAWDRPYKKAVPPAKALAILEEEVKVGKLDAALFTLFVEAEIYKLVNRAAP